jgi:hypothetical protein
LLAHEVLNPVWAVAATSLKFTRRWWLRQIDWDGQRLAAPV